MEYSEINDYPPANTLEQRNHNDYPIMRCENCYEILKINSNTNKKEIELKCEKEGITKNIPYKKFFEKLKKYEDINCCQFCKKKNPSQKYYLCKACSNKILCQNCFKTHCKKHDMDVRVVSTKNGVLLRIKDDCRAFNPVEMNQIFNPDDPSKNIGIRMISKIADEFSYQNTFGLNVLTIVIK